MIHLDNNATTRPCEEAVRAARDAMETDWHNPSSSHRAGQAARRGVELARASVASLIGCKGREIVFTSGGTESIHLAVRGLLALMPESRRTVVTTPTAETADTAHTGTTGPTETGVEAPPSKDEPKPCGCAQPAGSWPLSLLRRR